MRGMDIDELVKREKQVSDGLQGLLDDMFAAIDEDAPAATKAELAVRGKTKLSTYAKLCDDLHGVQLENIQRQYGKFVKELEQFLTELEAKG